MLHQAEQPHVRIQQFLLTGSPLPAPFVIVQYQNIALSDEADASQKHPADSAGNCSPHTFAVTFKDVVLRIPYKLHQTLLYFKHPPLVFVKSRRAANRSGIVTAEIIFFVGTIFYYVF